MRQSDFGQTFLDQAGCFILTPTQPSNPMFRRVEEIGSWEKQHIQSDQRSITISSPPNASSVVYRVLDSNTTRLHLNCAQNAACTAAIQLIATWLDSPLISDGCGGHWKGLHTLPTSGPVCAVHSSRATVNMPKLPMIPKNNNTDNLALIITIKNLITRLENIPKQYLGGMM
jgi:hypothetical protein